MALARGEAAVRREIDARAAQTGGPRDRDADRVAGYFHAVLERAGLDARRRRRSRPSSPRSTRARTSGAWRCRAPPRRSRRCARADFASAWSRTRTAASRRCCEAAGLAPHLETIVDSHLEGVEKPDPEIFRRALERLGVPAARTVYVGDIFAIDVLGARAAGLAAILIDETGGYADVECPRIAALAELHAPA